MRKLTEFVVYERVETFSVLVFVFIVWVSNCFGSSGYRFPFPPCADRNNIHRGSFLRAPVLPLCDISDRIHYWTRRSSFWTRTAVYVTLEIGSSRIFKNSNNYF